MSAKLTQLSDEALGRAVDIVLDAMRDAGIETVGDGVAALFGAMTRVMAVAPPRDGEAMTKAVVDALPGAAAAMTSHVEKARALRDARPQGTS